MWIDIIGGCDWPVSSKKGFSKFASFIYPVGVDLVDYLREGYGRCNKREK